MAKYLRWFVTLVCVPLMLAALACSDNGTPVAPETSGGGSSGSGSTGGGGTSTTPQSGSLTINMTDSPFSDARALLVTFSEVSVHRTEGDSWQTIPFASGTTRTCDLKKLTGPTDVLGVGSLPAGKYTQVRLVVASADLYFDNPSSGPACAPTISAPAGDSAAVKISSGEVKLNQEFTVTTGGTTMLLDFDGDQSVKQTGSSNGNGSGRGGSNGDPSTYIMTPVIRVVSVS